MADKKFYEEKLITLAEELLKTTIDAYTDGFGVSIFLEPRPLDPCQGVHITVRKEEEVDIPNIDVISIAQPCKWTYDAPFEPGLYFYRDSTKPEFEHACLVRVEEKDLDSVQNTNTNSLALRCSSPTRLDGKKFFASPLGEWLGPFPDKDLNKFLQNVIQDKKA